MHRIALPPAMHVRSAAPAHAPHGVPFPATRQIPAWAAGHGAPPAQAAPGVQLNPYCSPQVTSSSSLGAGRPGTAGRIRKGVLAETATQQSDTNNDSCTAQRLIRNAPKRMAEGSKVTRVMHRAVCASALENAREFRSAKKSSWLVSKWCWSHGRRLGLGRGWRTASATVREAPLRTTSRVVQGVWAGSLRFR